MTLNMMGILILLKDLTINADRGNIIFPVLEPFGSHSRFLFYRQTHETELSERYVFTMSYTLNDSGRS